MCVCVVCVCINACVCDGASGHHAVPVRAHGRAILWEQAARWRAWGRAQGHALAGGCVHRGTVLQAGMRIGHAACTEAGYSVHQTPTRRTPRAKQVCVKEATTPASHRARNQASGDAAAMHATCRSSM